MRHAAGSSIKSALFHNWVHDSRDDKVTATRGSYLKLSQELAGLGGDASFYKADSETQFSRKIFSNVVSNGFSEQRLCLICLKEPVVCRTRGHLMEPL